MERTAELKKTKWAVDPMHSEIAFKVKHLMISTVTGSFKNFSGTVTSPSENFEEAEIQFSVDVNSISTNQEARDNHLKAAEFFDAAKYPEITFKSTSFKKQQGQDFLVLGKLTMKGVTKEVELKAVFGGLAKADQGHLKAGFEVTGTINRNDFGLNYNVLTEAGGLALGEEIKLVANIQLAKEKES